MPDTATIAKEYGPWGAVAAMILYLLAQNAGVVPGGKGQEMDAVARRVNDVADRVNTVDGRVDDHDGRIERAWSAVRQERAARDQAFRDMNTRLRAVELVTGRLTDRLDDQRANLSALQATLTAMNGTLSEMKREQGVIGERVNGIARQVGVDRSQDGGR